MVSTSGSLSRCNWGNEIAITGDCNKRKYRAPAETRGENLKLALQTRPNRLSGCLHILSRKLDIPSSCSIWSRTIHRSRFCFSSWRIERRPYLRKGCAKEGPDSSLLFSTNELRIIHVIAATCHSRAVRLKNGMRGSRAPIRLMSRMFWWQANWSFGFCSMRAAKAALRSFGPDTVRLRVVFINAVALFG
jgi:hypothetical protein